MDAFPKDTFSGTVSQVRMNATTVQNVVTYNTIIDFDNPEMKLFPGMTAYITIPVAEARQRFAGSQRGAALQARHEGGGDSRAVQTIWTDLRRTDGNAGGQRSGIWGHRRCRQTATCSR